uniref:Purine nucleoside phosphorylase n=1 Tax=Plectus sambesii TaxID=2011161 RepID=A0A914VB94_9BILA
MSASAANGEDVHVKIVHPEGAKTRTLLRLASVESPEHEREKSIVIADPNNYDQIKAIADFIVNALQLSDTPTIGIICGTGLGSLAYEITEARGIKYSEIPGFPVSTVSGHKGKLIFGKLENKNVFCLQGRIHAYEGYSPAECSVPIRVMKLLGVEALIMTSAVGGTNENYKQGDVMLVKDHIFYPGFGLRSPLRGRNDPRFGPRFPSMNNAYDKDLRELAHLVAKQKGWSLREGVYAMVGGPQFETPAECRLLRAAGADAVGMSVCHETIVARHCGIKVLCMTLVTNIAIVDGDIIPKVDSFHEEVLEEGRKATECVSSLVKGIINALH